MFLIGEELKNKYQAPRLTRALRNAFPKASWELQDPRALTAILDPAAPQSWRGWYVPRGGAGVGEHQLAPAAAQHELDDAEDELVELKKNLADGHGDVAEIAAEIEKKEEEAGPRSPPSPVAALPDGGPYFGNTAPPFHSAAGCLARAWWRVALAAYITSPRGVRVSTL